MKHSLILSLLVLTTCVQSQTLNTQLKPSPGWLTVDTIMQDPKWMGTSPSNVFWSEDGKKVYFSWRRDGDEGDSLYVVDEEGGAPRRVSLEERKVLPSRYGDYTRDRRKKVYSKDGDLFLFDVRKNREMQLTKTLSDESNPRFTFDQQKIVFVRDGNLFERTIDDGIETQITNLQKGAKPPEQRKSELQKLMERQQLELFRVLKKHKEDQEARKRYEELLKERMPKPFYLGQKSAFDFVLSPDERFVTFVLSERPADAKRTIVPNYVTESGFTEDIAGRSMVGEPEAAFEFFVYDIAHDTVTQVKTDNVPGVIPPNVASDTSKGKQKPREVFFSGPFWSDNGNTAFIQMFSRDNKDRWIVLLDCEKAKFGKLLERQHDEAWIGGPGIRGFGFETAVGWMPDSKRIYFQSEADGWSHLYTVSIDDGNKVQLTSGRFEVYGLQMSRTKRRWYFTSNEVHYGEHQFYTMPINGGTRTRITSMEGFNEAVVSPNDERLVILYSFSNKMPELYLMDNAPGAKATKITDSPSAVFNSYDWRAPDILTFNASDGADVPARLFRPDHPNGAGVIFVHGAGYLQDAHKGWSDYFREYMFNNLLADKGYAVLDIDYRGSAGLGRDWRTSIYRHMGGRDLDDQVDGAKFLVDHYNVNPKRIGIYGGSYGGFLTLMAMFTKPGVFAAGAALRSVTDWSHYNGGYTSDILNLPQDDTTAYYQSSPIFHAEGLQGALLICHGVVDQNVHFQDDVRLVQRLIELRKKNWQLAIYPVENHGFREPTSWMDEYNRILKLFDDNLLVP